jgi:YVTN family beta-propeller protein
VKCQVVEIADKIPRTLALLLISEIIAFAIVVMLSNSAFAQQTLHDKRSSEVVNQNSRAQESSQIDVGASSHGIDVNEREDIVYVVKYNRDSVSIISGANNRKIGEDIPVGNFPWGIAVNDDTETGYVANSMVPSSSVSVIDLGNNTKKKDIPVGNGPLAIAVNENTNTVYVANHWSGNISIISGANNRKIGEDIPVGNGPSDIAVNENTNTV